MRRSFLGGFLFVVWSGLSSLNFFSGLYFIFLDIEKSKLPPNMCRWIIFIFKVWAGLVCLGRSHWYDKTKDWMDGSSSSDCDWLMIDDWDLKWIMDFADFSPYLVFWAFDARYGTELFTIEMIHSLFWILNRRRKQRKTNKRQTINFNFHFSYFKRWTLVLWTFGWCQDPDHRSCFVLLFAWNSFESQSSRGIGRVWSICFWSKNIFEGRRFLLSLVYRMKQYTAARHSRRYPSCWHQRLFDHRYRLWTKKGFDKSICDDLERQFLLYR